VDIVARFGGDEFAVLLDEISDPIDVVYIVERIRKELLPPMNIVGYETFASASIGIVIGSTLYVHAEDVVRDAEIAMNRARMQGPGRYAIFDTKMQEMAANRLSLEVDLRKAIDKNQFRIHYQPIVSLEAGRVTGFEALIRWLHPHRGLLYPSEFLPVAEEADLIIPISHWVLQEACNQLSNWQAQRPSDGHLSVSVNLSSKVLGDSSLPAEIASVISASGIDPSNLTVEITETQIMENPESVSDVLKTLNTAGMRIAIDDFGKGYSSLSYLATLPAQILKIDQSFIAELGKCGRTTAIVRAILSLGDCLGLEVIAEGVETEEQLRLLRELKCKHAQGYYFARPMEPEAAEWFISRNAVAGSAPASLGYRSSSL
jgi:EAL domain-containing protein (putative c-di-GMP-specific phosphodiesterase class I)